MYSPLTKYVLWTENGCHTSHSIEERTSLLSKDIFFRSLIKATFFQKTLFLLSWGFYKTCHFQYSRLPIFSTETTIIFSSSKEIFPTALDRFKANKIDLLHPTCSYAHTKCHIKIFSFDKLLPNCLYLFCSITEQTNECTFL